MRVRIADPRIGYVTNTYNDYGPSSNPVQKLKTILKWDLELSPSDIAKYKKGSLVEPVTPISVYINTNIPESLRPGVKAAIGEWENAFHTAGFKNVFSIKEGEPEFSIAPHQINISFSIVSTQNVETINDPKTNEILGAMILLNNTALENATLGFACTGGALYPKILKNKDCPELANEIIRATTSRLLGNSLGLTPNFAGSFAYTTQQLRNKKWVKENSISASVLDQIPFNYVAQPEDKMALTDLFPKVSHYDKWAVEFGYRVFPDNKNEKQDKISLAPILNKAKTNSFLLYIATSSDDFRAQANDLASDRTNGYELGIKNIIQILPKFKDASVNWTIEKESWESFDLLLTTARTAYKQYLIQTVNGLGLIMKTPVIKGYNENAITYPTTASQREIIGFLEKYLFSGVPGYLEDSTYRRIRGTQAIDLMFEISKGISQASTKAFVNIAQQEDKRSGEYYSLENYINDINRLIFLNFDPNKKPDALMRKVQTNYLISFLTTLYHDGETFENNTTLNESVQATLKNYAKQITVLSTKHTDAPTRAHYAMLASVIKKEMVKKVSPTPVPVPVPVK
jgi:hypothetical protein